MIPSEHESEQGLARGASSEATGQLYSRSQALLKVTTVLPDFSP